MKTPLVYYGGKTNLIARVLPLIPAHAGYCEPFCGGAATFFAKEKVKFETLNDLDLRLITFYRVCQDPAKYEALQAKVRGTLHHEALYLEARQALGRKAEDYVPSLDDVETAYLVWVNIAQALNCGFGKGWGFVRPNDSGATSVQKTMRRKDSLRTDELCRRLENVQIFCRPALDVLAAVDSPDTFHFVDPPYLGADMGHYEGYTESDFAALLELLAELSGKWMLTTYDHPLLAEAAARHGWHQVRVEQNISASASSG